MSALPLYNIPEKTVLKVVKEGKKRDNPTPVTMSLETLLRVTELQRLIMKRYNLRYNSFADLLMIMGYYIKNGLALSKWAIYDLQPGNDTSHSATYERIGVLIGKGLLEYGDKECKYVIPSRKALKELSELCK